MTADDSQADVATCDLCGKEACPATEDCMAIVCVGKCHHPREHDVYHMDCLKKHMRAYTRNMGARWSGFLCPKGKGKGTVAKIPCPAKVSHAQRIIIKTNKDKGQQAAARQTAHAHQAARPQKAAAKAAAGPAQAKLPRLPPKPKRQREPYLPTEYVPAPAAPEPVKRDPLGRNLATATAAAAEAAKAKAAKKNARRAAARQRKQEQQADGVADAAAAAAVEQEQEEEVEEDDEQLQVRPWADSGSGTAWAAQESDAADPAAAWAAPVEGVGDNDEEAAGSAWAGVTAPESDWMDMREAADAAAAWAAIFGDNSSTPSAAGTPMGAAHASPFSTTWDDAASSSLELPHAVQQQEQRQGSRLASPNTVAAAAALDVAPNAPSVIDWLHASSSTSPVLEQGVGQNSSAAVAEPELLSSAAAAAAVLLPMHASRAPVEGSSLGSLAQLQSTDNSSNHSSTIYSSTYHSSTTPYAAGSPKGGLRQILESRLRRDSPDSSPAPQAGMGPPQLTPGQPSPSKMHAVLAAALVRNAAVAAGTSLQAPPASAAPVPAAAHAAASASTAMPSSSGLTSFPGFQLPSALLSQQQQQHQQQHSLAVPTIAAATDAVTTITTSSAAACAARQNPDQGSLWVVPTCTPLSASTVMHASPLAEHGLHTTLASALQQVHQQQPQLLQQGPGAASCGAFVGGQQQQEQQATAALWPGQQQEQQQLSSAALQPASSLGLDVQAAAALLVANGPVAGGGVMGQQGLSLLAGMPQPGILANGPLSWQPQPQQQPTLTLPTTHQSYPPAGSTAAAMQPGSCAAAAANAASFVMDSSSSSSAAAAAAGLPEPSVATRDAAAASAMVSVPWWAAVSGGGATSPAGEAAGSAAEAMAPACNVPSSAAPAAASAAGISLPAGATAAAAAGTLGDSTVLAAESVPVTPAADSRTSSLTASAAGPNAVGAALGGSHSSEGSVTAAGTSTGLAAATLTFGPSAMAAPANSRTEHLSTSRPALGQQQPAEQQLARQSSTSVVPTQRLGTQPQLEGQQVEGTAQSVRQQQCPAPAAADGAAKLAAANSNKYIPPHVRRRLQQQLLLQEEAPGSPHTSSSAAAAAATPAAAPKHADVGPPMMTHVTSAAGSASMHGPSNNSSSSSSGTTTTTCPKVNTASKAPGPASVGVMHPDNLEEDPTHPGVLAAYHVAGRKDMPAADSAMQQLPEQPASAAAAGAVLTAGVDEQDDLDDLLALLGV